MKLLTVGVAAILLATGTLLFLSHRGAVAAECAQPIDDVVALIEEAGGELIDLIDVPGEGFDQLIVAEFDGTIAVRPGAARLRRGRPDAPGRSRGAGRGVMGGTKP